MKTPTPEQIRSAIASVEWFAKNKDNFKFPRTSAGDCERLGFALRYHIDTLKFVLPFALKMMEKPSDGMMDVINSYQDYGCLETFKAMRDQAIEEICKENPENFTDANQPINKTAKTL